MGDMQSLRQKLDSIRQWCGRIACSLPNRLPLIRRRLAIAALVTMLIVLIASWWISQRVLLSTQQITRESLKSILWANTTMLQNWLGEQQASATKMASYEPVRTSASELIAKSELDFHWDAQDLNGLPEVARLQEALRSDEYLGWCIFNTRHLVVASSFDNYVGLTLPIPNHVRQAILARQATICLPIKSPVAILSEGPLSIPGGPIMGAIAPIQSGDEVTGSLMLLINPMGRFSELFSFTRTGFSGETYAFDRNGRLLTQSRLEKQLRDAGVLPNDIRVVSPLNVTLRDPGVNLTLGHRPSVSISEQPLTFMADHAIRGGSSDNVDGYNDYRGVRVVGAWTWLPGYAVGVATEVNRDEALAPIQNLKRGFFWLLSILVFTVFGFLFLFVSNDAAKLRQPENADSPNRRFGRYHLGEILGSGGMGSVYRGTHELLRRPVAIKVLSREDASEQSINRFEREVQITASLRHPNTIDVYDYGRTDDGTFFYVMEFVDGITLQQLIDVFGAQPPSRVIHLLLQICGSLREAHRGGLIHRDIKPANILLSFEAGVIDWIKVLDFGLIKNIAASPEDLALTRSDTITGTPMYMSPESVRDPTTSDALSDLYSVGAVGYALLTGCAIFEGTGAVDICMKQLNEDPIRPEKRLGFPLPEDLQNVLMSCLRKDPQDRPRDMEHLASALRSCEDALAWTEADAIHWWEVVYAQQATEIKTHVNPNVSTGIVDHDTLDKEA
jgi:serine/threonine-protein kinase